MRLQSKRREKLLLVLIASLLIYSIHTNPAEPTAPSAIENSPDEADAVHKHALTSMTFISCSDQRLLTSKSSTQAWESMLLHPNNLLVWMGDAIYPEDSSISSLEEAYKTLINSEPYKKAKRYFRDIDGVWDDHDYGVNDGFKIYENKDESQQLYLDFLELPPNDIRRKRKGVYTSHLFGAASKKKSNRAKLILLDTRYHRDNTRIPSIANRDELLFSLYNAGIRFASSIFGFGSHYDGDILGEEQWIWLERQLKDSSAGIHIIVSSIQVTTTFSFVESWGHYPIARTRLFSLIQKHKPGGLMFLSGDVHFGELLGKEGGVAEITSSGVTHSMKDGVFSKLYKYVLLPLYTGSRRTKADYFIGMNFGVINITYKDGGADVDTSVYDSENNLRLNWKQSFEDAEDYNERYMKLNQIKQLIPDLSYTQMCLRIFAALLSISWSLELIWIAIHFLVKRTSRVKAIKRE